MSKEGGKVRAGPERSAAMFKMHLKGKTHKEIAEFFDVSETIVAREAMKYKWKKLTGEFYQKAYDTVISAGAKKVATHIMDLIAHQVKLLRKKIEENPAFEIPVEQLRELRQLAEMLIKENRLTDNKPTDNISGVVETRIILPPGVKAFGVDPPGPGVKELEYKPEEKKKTDSLDLSQILDDE